MEKKDPGGLSFIWLRLPSVGNTPILSTLSRQIKPQGPKEKESNSFEILSAGVLHCGGVQGAARPHGGEAEGDEAGGQHLQADSQPHPERDYWHLKLDTEEKCEPRGVKKYYREYSE